MILEVDTVQDDCDLFDSAPKRALYYVGFEEIVEGFGLTTALVYLSGAKGLRLST